MKSPITLIAVAVSAMLAGAGIFHPNAVVASTSISLLLLVLAGGIIAAVVCRNRVGAAWRGSAVFATTYFLFTVLVGDIYAALNSQRGIAAEPPRPVFITTYWLAGAYDRLGLPEIWTRGGSRVPSLFLLRVSPSLSQFPEFIGITEFQAFMKTGQCIITIWMGLIGACIGWSLSMPRDEK